MNTTPDSTGPQPTETPNETCTYLKHAQHYCHVHGLPENLAAAYADMWKEEDAQVFKELDALCGMGMSCPDLENTHPPFNGSLLRRRYWKKVKEGI